MGILTRWQGDAFVITSDSPAGNAATRRAPPHKVEDYAVWTDGGWSQVKTDALKFASLEDADEYVRANFAKVTG